MQIGSVEPKILNIHFKVLTGARARATRDNLVTHSLALQTSFQSYLSTFGNKSNSPWSYARILLSVCTSHLGNWKLASLPLTGSRFMPAFNKKLIMVINGIQTFSAWLTVRPRATPCAYQTTPTSASPRTSIKTMPKIRIARPLYAEGVLWTGTHLLVRQRNIVVRHDWRTSSCS